MGYNSQKYLLNLQNAVQNGFFCLISCICHKKVVTLQPKNAINRALVAKKVAKLK